MTIKVGINGMGRIGRMIVRASIGSKDKDLELSNMIKNEKNRQLNEYSIIHFKKVEQKSYVKKI